MWIRFGELVEVGEFVCIHKCSFENVEECIEDSE